MQRATMENDSFLLHDESFDFFGRRFLQDNSTNTTLTMSNSGQALKDTMKVYGSIFAVAFFLFCYLRLKYPKAFNIRTWVEDLQCDLAEDTAAYGFFSWLWQVRIPTDDEIREQCVRIFHHCHFQSLRFKSQTYIHSNRGWMLSAFSGCFILVSRFVS